MQLPAIAPSAGPHAAFALMLALGCGSTTETVDPVAGSGGAGSGNAGPGGSAGAGTGATGGDGAASTGGDSTGGTGGAHTIRLGEVVPDFSLLDVNPASPTTGQAVSPRDYLEQVSGWYFGHAT